MLVSKATGNSVLFPEEDKALLQALQCFHFLNNLCQWQDWGKEPNKNFSGTGQDAH